MIKQLSICDCATPLIWTFVFPGAQYWCPYCGKTWEHEEPEKIKNTEELQKRFELYKKHSESYLDAKSTQVCSEMKLHGKWVKQENLPQDFKDKVQKLIDDYEFKVVLGEQNEVHK